MYCSVFIPEVHLLPILYTAIPPHRLSESIILYSKLYDVGAEPSSFEMTSDIFSHLNWIAEQSFLDWVDLSAFLPPIGKLHLLRNARFVCRDKLTVNELGIFLRNSIIRLWCKDNKKNIFKHSKLGLSKTILIDFVSQLWYCAKSERM